MEKINKKILVIEDDEGFRAILQKSFEGTEFLLITAVDGQEGLLKVKEEQPDLILMDIIMPKMDGIQTAVKLKEFGNNTPIIFLTNVKDDEKISEAMVIGGGNMDYVVKTDVRVEEIIDRIRKRLNIGV
ncbi:MAG: response regulator [Candidatus Staskawiczbacteria bacterium]|nr:response regulator [Candidatus Staskawiczbacteria bacterium]